MLAHERKEGTIDDVIFDFIDPKQRGVVAVFHGNHENAAETKARVARNRAKKLYFDDNGFEMLLHPAFSHAILVVRSGTFSYCFSNDADPKVLWTQGTTEGARARLSEQAGQGIGLFVRLLTCVQGGCAKRKVAKQAALR